MNGVPVDYQDVSVFAVADPRIIAILSAFGEPVGQKGKGGGGGGGGGGNGRAETVDVGAGDDASRSLGFVGESGVNEGDIAAAANLLRSAQVERDIRLERVFVLALAAHVLVALRTSFVTGSQFTASSSTQT